MTPRRPVRVWVGEPRPAHRAEVVGPRGLTQEVLDEEPEATDAQVESGDDAFWRSLLTPRRLARIESVVAARLASVTVALDRLLDPHNVAAVLRTAEGLGLCRVHLVPHEGQDARAHRRVTQDADKWLDVEMHESGAACARALRERGFSVYAGHLGEQALPYTEIPASAPVALLFGNEHEGPSAETLAACDGTFRIPMAGFAQSFNVSVAAGIALARLCALRRSHLGAPGDLSAEERPALRSRFLKLGAKLARRAGRPARGTSSNANPNPNAMTTATATATSNPTANATSTATPTPTAR